MPKLVDHGERRRRIADALLRVAADRGVEAVSLRHVAAEAGVTAGMVQHYFSNKEELLHFALDAVTENVTARISTGDDEPGAIVRELLTQLLPLDEQRRIEGRVSVTFFAYAATNPAIAEALRANSMQQRDFLAEQIRSAQAAGQAPTALDPEMTAMTMLALVEGLGIQVNSGLFPPAEALRAFDDYLTVVFQKP
ncbi:TetR/AcrR family transcriptional regulator [Nocardia brevicatena]|uniref:TetR/AcrR family transcriptional regulator n=1 Tax=Nocardia brevicatena TaxID=37327 RepID=UPI0005948E08|nr:TetR/AcrR family transcriptional regulator [Nocardia brevicatena]